MELKSKTLENVTKKAKKYIERNMDIVAFQKDTYELTTQLGETLWKISSEGKVSGKIGKFLSEYEKWRKEGNKFQGYPANMLLGTFELPRPYQKEEYLVVLHPDELSEEEICEINNWTNIPFSRSLWEMGKYKVYITITGDILVSLHDPNLIPAG